ncbi:MAG: S49 family peptidase, partial [Chlamydiales bacterium]
QVTAAKIEEMLLDSREDSLKNGRVKGILLVINSPGGSANESNIIYRLLKQYKERYDVPIYSYVNGFCASGGYYIACATDKILANEVSLIGSVGVLGWPPYMNVSDALEKIGVNSKTVFAGKGKDEMNPFRAWKPDEGLSRQQIVDFYYSTFVNIVTENRPNLPEEKLINDYGAEIYPAYLAKEYGYIDESNLLLSDALGLLATASGINEDEKYQVITFKTKSWWKEAIKSQSESPLLTGKIKHVFSLPGSEDMSPQYIYVP